METPNTQITQEDLDKINLMDLSEQEIIDLIQNTEHLGNPHSQGSAIEKLFYSQMLTAGTLKFMTKGSLKKAYNTYMNQSQVRQVIQENISNGGHFCSIAQGVQLGVEEFFHSEGNKHFDCDEMYELYDAYRETAQARHWGFAV
jgi:hypothetical protein